MYLFQGSYGRLGLGTSENQSTLVSVGTFPENTVVRKITSSKGSDGHSLAVTADGQVLSWGDGELKIDLELVFNTKINSIVFTRVGT